MAHTLAGHRFAEFARLSLRVNGALTRAGDVLVDELGLTSSRWQALGVIHSRSTTVPRLARRLGLTRQSVQRTTDRLVEDGLAQLLPNPDHKKSPLVAVTVQGNEMFAEAQRRYEGWANCVGSSLNAADLATACRLLNIVSDCLAAMDPLVPPP